MSRPEVCLCMIAKNEAPNIRDTLATIKPFIAHWLIVDTGSTDGTQDVVREFMSDMPGELIERPWVNFGHNRSEALALAQGRAEYIFDMDADDHFVAAPDFAWIGEERHDLYDVKHERGSVSYWAPHLMRDGLDWRYVGVVHEFLNGDPAQTRSRIDGAHVWSRSAGARSRDPHTYKRDALLLEQGLLDEPHNNRYMFYLAQSYRDCGDRELAIRYYERRFEMGGWEEECFYSLYQIGVQKIRRGDPWGECVAAMMRAHESRPSRAEPLFILGLEHLHRKEWASAWIYLRQAADLDVPPGDILFVEHEVYQWRALLEAGVAAYWAGYWNEAHAMNERLLARPNLPDHARNQAMENQRYTEEKLAA